MRARTRLYALYGVVSLCMALMLGYQVPRTSAQAYPNTITFLNGTGEYALVKLVGPSQLTVGVPAGHNSSVN